MLKYLFAVFALISGALLFMVFGIGVPKVYVPDVPAATTPHTYDDPEAGFDNPVRPIANIHMYVVHFVPADAARLSLPLASIEQTLAQLKRFHEQQLAGRSRLSYSVYPEPVVGRLGNSAYETLSSDVLDSDSSEFLSTYAAIASTLATVAEEINARVLSKSGDLYEASFFENTTIEGEYSVLLILYGGTLDTAAAADVFYNRSPEKDAEFAELTGLPRSIARTADVSEVDGGMIVNASLLTSRERAHDGTTIIAHEFYHTLNIPDGYEYHESDAYGRNLSFTHDIMGLRRNEPLERAYLDRAWLARMGW